MNDIRLKSFGIFCLAVAAGLIFTFLVYPHIESPLKLSLDPDRFGELGTNMYRGEGFVYSNPTVPALDRGPGYPYLIATVFNIVKGENFKALQIAQALLHGLTGVFVFLIAKKYFNPQTALRAQFIAALHPILIWFIPRVWTETWYTFLTILLLYCLVQLFERPTILLSLATGVLFGISILTRSTLLLLLPLISLIFLYKRGKSGIIFAVVLFLSGVLYLLPWQIRNYKLTNKIVLTQVSLGFNLIEGDVIGERWQEEKFASIGLWEEGYVRVDSLLKGTGYQSNEPRGDRLLTRVAFDRYLHKPVEFLRRCGINFLTFWYLGETKLKSIALLICQVPLILFGLIGLFKSRSIKLPLAPVLTFLVYFVVLSSMIYGIGRFSVPLIPVLLLFANSVG